MDLYIKFTFWAVIFGIIVRFCAMATLEFPSKKTTSLGECLVTTLLMIAQAVWAGIVLWTN